MSLFTLTGTCRADTFCFEEAAREYNVSPLLLWGISKTESGFNPHAVNWNTNKTYDYCHMQINSIWAKELGKERWDALIDPCQCTRTGAWILSQCIQRHGYSWNAVGCYNSNTPSKRDKYASKVYRAIRSITSHSSNTSVAGNQPTKAAGENLMTATEQPWQIFIGGDSDAVK